MSGRPYILAESYWGTVRDTVYDVAILPWGATEAHNFHLPYSTDVIECDVLAAESARLAWERGAKVMVLPTIPFGTETNMHKLPLAINVDPSTLFRFVTDVIHSCLASGVKKIVLLNSHGGNEMKPLLRERQ